jgi:predicted deacylase
VAGTLDGHGPANLERLRAALRRLVAEETPRTELGSLRLTLLRLAIDADIVLDLHCDSEALMHVYLGAARWPDGADLAAELGSEATLLADESGGNPFDEVFSGLWTKLKGLIPEHPVPHGALAATVELRGRGNVDDALAAADAAALLRFLMRRGVIAGDPGPLPALKTDAVPLAAVDVPRSPAAGMLIYQRAPGDRIRAGDAIADLLDPLTGGRTPIRAQTDGVLFARRAGRLVRPGQTIAKIAGTLTLPTRTGTLLEP